MHKANMPSGASQPGLVSPENPNNRMGAQQPSEPIDMMPPLSLVMGYPSGGMDEGGLDEVQSWSDGSPRNQGMGQTPSGGGGVAPLTPVPNQQQNPGRRQGHGIAMPLTGADLDGDPTYMTPNIQHMQGMATPLGVPPCPVPSTTSVADNLFSLDFLQSVASSLDDFDRPDGDINFERDFGQWFNPDDVPPSPVPSTTSVADSLFSSDFIQSVASPLDDFDPSIFRSDGGLNFERDFGQWFNHPDEAVLSKSKRPRS